jgi:hypothetical protein
MGAAAQAFWTAAACLAADQATFGPAWRYELVDGSIVARAAPPPAHGAILAGLASSQGDVSAIPNDKAD